MQKKLPRSLVKDVLHSKTLVASLFVFLAGKANFMTGNWIQSFLPTSTLSPDLLLHYLPYTPAFEYVAEFALLLAMLLLFFTVVWKRSQILPYILANFATLYFLRALIITLTPLAQSSPTKIEPNFYGVTFSGMFPSGHTALATIIFLLIRKESSLTTARNLALFLVILEGASLLMSHGHYSIDLVGGAMLAYVVYRFLLRFRAQLMISNSQ